jgi:hypothetical protein
VLAAVTRAAPPEAGEPVKALVGAHLPWRGTGQAAVDVAVPVDLLAAVTVDDIWHDVSRSGAPLATPLIDPQAFQVVVDPQNKTPPEVTKFPTAPGAPVAALAFDHTSHDLTVTLTYVPSTASLQTVVVLQKITTPAQPGTIEQPQIIPGGTSPTVVSAGFQAGDIWSAFAFIQGVAPPTPVNQQAA